LLRRASFVVAQNAASASELSGVLAPQRIVVLPTPVEQVQAPPLHRRPHAVFVGRFSKDKDLLHLLEAWLAVVALRPEARLTLVGDGGEHQSVEAELRRLVTHLEPLARTVTFTGWVEDVTPYLASSDVFVFPSLTEGMSNALLEACAWGRVVVASDIPANRAVLADDHPLIFPAGDVDALSKKLLLAFDDHRIAEDTRHRALTGASIFSIENVVKRLENLLKQANDTARRGPSQEDAGPRTPRIDTRCSAAGTVDEVQTHSD
jgi:glycosyltransferase involved in cell wall biosynthesis